MTRRPWITRRTLALSAVFALAVTACGSAELTLPADQSRPSVPEFVTPAPSGTGGDVVVAYPEEPSRWAGDLGGDVAAQDLAALWGLPLLRVGPAGQIRAGLVTDWTVQPGSPFRVTLELAPGSWSDGSPVTAADVVATLEVVRAGRESEFLPLLAVTGEGQRVELTFDTPYVRWPDLLVEAGPVLPAAVLAEAGVDGYAQTVPVSGGRFALAEYVPGRSARFVAHADSPLGPPRLDSVEIAFTPRYETALGLLDDGRADVVLGYTALNGRARAEEIDGVDAETPLGGTWAGLAFRRSGPLGEPGDAASRRGIADVLEIGELVDGLLGPAGEVAETPWAGVPLPTEPEDANPPGVDLVLVVPSANEVLAFTGRAIERDLSARGIGADLVYEPSPRFAEVIGGERDGALRLFRTASRPSLTRWLPDTQHDLGRAADAAGWPSDAAEEALAAVADQAAVIPLYRVGVLHAWKGVEGVRPSAWPGVGFWNVGEWAVTAPARIGAEQATGATLPHSSEQFAPTHARVAEQADAHG